jgi:peptidoglycan recognition protein LD
MQIQAFTNGLKDIPYNFLIGDDGNTYEGRGFHFEGEIFKNNYTIETGLIIAFIGTFDDHPPSLHQVATFNAFLDNSVSQGVLVNNYTMVPDTDAPHSGILNVIGGSNRYRPGELKTL